MKITNAMCKEFDRALLSRVVPDVRRNVPGVRTSDAWTYRYAAGHREFHYKKFMWYGRASSAYAARYNGWCAYLRKIGVREYQL